MGDKKMGRPTENPKPHHMGVRLDDESKEILDTYCEQKKVSKMEGIRRGVKKLKDDLKK